MDVTIPPYERQSCERCRTEKVAAALQLHPFTGQRVCRDCITIQCHDCGRDRSDVLARAIGDEGTVAYCTACCSTYPGRAWMRRQLPDDERRMLLDRLRVVHAHPRLDELEAAVRIQSPDLDDFAVCRQPGTSRRVARTPSSPRSPSRRWRDAPRRLAVSEASTLFSAVFEGLNDGYVELRMKALSGTIRQEFIPITDLDRFTAPALDHLAGWHVWFGAAARGERTNGTKANCTWMPALWADVDFKMTPESDVRAALKEWPLEPNLVVESGNGLHCYWCLKEPLDLRVDLPEAERALRRLAAWTGGDLAATDASHVLRVPGTVNAKPEYGKPRPVRLIRHDTTYRANLAEFDELMPDDPGRDAASHGETKYTVADDGFVYEGKGRHHRLFAEAGRLRRLGYTETSILAALRARNPELCKPPITDRDLVDMARRASRMYEPDPTEETIHRTAAAKADAKTTSTPTVFQYPAVAGNIRDYILHPLDTYDGWFPRGRVSLAGGSSGAGKTTLVTGLLEAQARGASYLGHDGAGLPYLILFADRGELSNRETLERMGLAGQPMPIAHLPVCWGETAVRRVLAAIEGHDPLPAAVFVEGADTLVEDPSKPAHVAPFLSSLQQVAAHYHVALILSVGSPKQKPKGTIRPEARPHLRIATVGAHERDRCRSISK